jgi:hypothetical protein
VVDGLPYVSRDTLKTFLLEQGIKPGSVESYLKTSGREGMIVRDLLDAKIIRKEGKGWVVVDQGFGDELLLKI